MRNKYFPFPKWSLGIALSVTLIADVCFGQCPVIVVSASASPSIFCSGNSSQLTVTTGVQGGGYSVIQIPFAPDSGSGTPVTLMDDEISGMFPIGFNFMFFGQIYYQ